MKRFLLTCLFALPASAQNIWVLPAAPSIPVGGYQTVTAILTGTPSEKVTWTSDGGTVVNASCQTLSTNEYCTAGVTAATAGTFT